MGTWSSGPGCRKDGWDWVAGGRAGVRTALGSILSFTKSRRWWRTPVSHPSSGDEDVG